MGEKNLRIAWLFPSLELGNYWHPVLSEFAKTYPETTVFTGVWPGYSPGFENTFAVKVVGEMTFVNMVKSETGYSKGFINASPAIAGELLQYKPNVVFTSGFCIWTIFALLLKPLGGWQVVIVYDGSSPGVDYRNSKIRTFLRRMLSRLTAGFITNSQAGKDYLTQYLGVDEQRIFARPYQVPDVNALLKQSQQVDLPTEQLQRPVFLFTGQVIPRKGLDRLLLACKLLHDRGYRDYTLLVAGEGAQRQELQAFCTEQGLDDNVCWLGWVNYGQLGEYFRNADVFILPALEDVWGMVVLEAMAFGKPVLCSKWAGAAELIAEGENGSVFDPYEPEAIVEAMIHLMKQPESWPRMGQRSQEIIVHHTPVNAARFLAKVTDTVIEVVL
jgi:glycosyltransferase involved in cell wall biosynthesis